MPNEADLLLTELRKAIKVEPGDYIVTIDPRHVDIVQMADLAEELWKQNIRLHAIVTTDPAAIRFVKVESPETIQVEEKP